ncbi:MAG TPA: hypothetical protein VF099_11370 [Ktedonobacterales bacterium]
MSAAPQLSCADEDRCSSAQAPAMATAQTGNMVITKGRKISLAECEARSNAWKTSYRTKEQDNKGHDNGNQPDISTHQ